MAIEDRNLAVGTRLSASYKKQTYVCTIEAGENGEGVVFVLDSGQRFKSPSTAGSHIMVGKAVNGWRFGSLEGYAPTAAEPKPEAATRKKGPQAHLPGAKPTGHARRQDQVLLHCLHEGLPGRRGRAAQRLPEGHRTDDPELTAAADEGTTTQ
jgi:hypothetical protein